METVDLLPFLKIIVWIFIVVLIIGVLFLIEPWLIRTSRSVGSKKKNPVPDAYSRPHPITPRKFFSAVEYRLWRCLREVVPRDMNADLFAKVRWEDVWQADGGPNRMRYRGFLRSRHIDFVLYDRAENRISLLIELNDRSHQRRDRKKRDQRLRDFCQDTGIPLLILFPQKYFDQNDIQRLLTKAIASAP